MSSVEILDSRPTGGKAFHYRGNRLEWTVVLEEADGTPVVGADITVRLRDAKQALQPTLTPTSGQPGHWKLLIPNTAKTLLYNDAWALEFAQDGIVKWVLDTQFTTQSRQQPTISDNDPLTIKLPVPAGEQTLTLQAPGGGTGGGGLTLEEVNALIAAALAGFSGGVPIHLIAGQTYTVFANTQVVFKKRLKIDGRMKIDGRLIQV